MVLTCLLPDNIMQYVANQWNTPLYAHQKPMAQPPEQMHLRMIDECSVKSKEQSYLNSNPKIMLLTKNPLKIAAQKNLTRDQSKIPKSLKEFCPLAYNPIILYTPPYSDNQERVKQYMGWATICPTMELWWEESNHTPPLPPTVPAMPTPLSQTVPALAQITQPPTLTVEMDMMTTHGLVPYLNLMSQMMIKTSAQKQLFLMMKTLMSTIPAQTAVSTIAAAIAQAMDTAAESEMQQTNPQSPQEQYSSKNCETFTESQWVDTTIHQDHGVTSDLTCSTDGRSSQVLASHLSQGPPMSQQDSLTQLATNYSTSMQQKNVKDSGTRKKETAPYTKKKPQK